VSAKPRGGLLGLVDRLFFVPAARRTRGPRPLPKEVFWHVLEYWRCTRDSPY
jgi:hypothetical protein